MFVRPMRIELGRSFIRPCGTAAWWSARAVCSSNFHKLSVRSWINRLRI